MQDIIRSPVFDDIINGRAPQVNFLVNGREYHLAYYLTNGIYPKWATFIQSIPIPQGPKAVLYAQRQELSEKMSSVLSEFYKLDLPLSKIPPFLGIKSRLERLGEHVSYSKI